MKQFRPDPDINVELYPGVAPLHDWLKKEIEKQEKRKSRKSSRRKARSFNEYYSLLRAERKAQRV